MQHPTFRSWARSLVLSLTCGALFASSNTAQAQQTPLASQGLALNRAGEALDSVVITAKKLNSRLGYGFYEAGCVFGVMLKPNTSASETFGFTAGQSYVFVGGGDKTTRNIDIIVTDSSGRVVKQDTEQDASPFVLFKPARTGRYKMTLRLRTSRNGTAFCAATVLRKGGYDVPLERIGQAIAKAAVASAYIFKSTNGGRFNQDRDTWALYGAVLQPKQSISSDFKRYSTANRAFIGVGDNGVKDLDLMVVNGNKQIVASDTKNGQAAAVAYKTNAGSYSVGLVNNSSNGPSLVMAMLVDLPAGLNLNASTGTGAGKGTANRSTPPVSTGRNSPFLGSWSGDWQDDDNMQEGEVSMLVRSDGSLTGTVVNSTANVKSPLRGYIQPNGTFNFTYSYNGTSYLAQGKVHLPEKVDDDIEICGDVTFTSGGRSFGKADVTLYKE